MIVSLLQNLYNCCEVNNGPHIGWRLLTTLADATTWGSPVLLALLLPMSPSASPAEIIAFKKLILGLAAGMSAAGAGTAGIAHAAYGIGNCNRDPERAQLNPQGNRNSGSTWCCLFNCCESEEDAPAATDAENPTLVFEEVTDEHDTGAPTPGQDL